MQTYDINFQYLACTKTSGAHPTLCFGQNLLGEWDVLACSSALPLRTGHSCSAHHCHPFLSELNRTIVIFFLRHLPCALLHHWCCDFDCRFWPRHEGDVCTELKRVETTTRQLCCINCCASALMNGQLAESVDDLGDDNKYYIVQQWSAAKNACRNGRITLQDRLLTC